MTVDVSGAYIKEDYQYVKKSHKTMLIFRRVQIKKNGQMGQPVGSLELRH